MDTSGLAAWLAAVTSAATLVVTTYVGGRREHRRWVRDALTDAFVAFLAASWKHSDTAREAASDTGVQQQDLARQYGEMRHQLTRLRLLATAEVLQAGEELLRRQRAVQDSAPGPEREQALAAAAVGRRAVVAAAKKEMGLS